MTLRILKPVIFFNPDREIIRDDTPNSDPTQAPVIKDFRPARYTRTDTPVAVPVEPALTPVPIEIPVIVEEVEDVPKDLSATEPASPSGNDTNENSTQVSEGSPATSHPSRSARQGPTASAAKVTPPTVQLPPKTGSV